MKKRSVRILHVEQGDEFEVGYHERIVNMEMAVGGGVLVFIAKEDEVA